MQDSGLLPHWFANLKKERMEILDRVEEKINQRVYDAFHGSKKEYASWLFNIHNGLGMKIDSQAWCGVKRPTHG